MREGCVDTLGGPTGHENVQVSGDRGDIHRIFLFVDGQEDDHIGAEAHAAGSLIGTKDDDVDLVIRLRDRSGS